ncbi:MAG: hypothetical protein NVSMB32_14450 [Actinomycetota bacterium]
MAPAEVEAALLEHPRVSEVAVVGRPDAEWGQAVVAIIVATPGPPPTLADLRAFVSPRLAPYKAPKALLIVASLPRGPTGKPTGLAALAADGDSRDSGA